MLYNKSREDYISFIERENPNLKSLRKKILLSINLFYIVMQILSLVSSFIALNIVTNPSIRIIFIIRLFYIVILFINLFFIFKELKYKPAITIITLSIVNIVTNFLFDNIEYDFKIIAIMSLLAGCLLSLHVITFLLKKNKFKIILNIIVVTLFYTLSIYLFNLSDKASQPYIFAFLIVSSFIFLLLFFQNYMGDYVHRKLINIIIEKTLYDPISKIKELELLKNDLSVYIGKSNEEDKEFLILGIYLHRFERLIEKYGYEYSNKVLKQVGDRLRQLEEHFKIYKISGVLFGLIPKKTMDIRNISQIEDEIQKVMNQAYLINEVVFDLPFRMVATTSPDDGVSSNRLLSNLHNTAYRSIPLNTQINNIIWFDHNSQKMKERQLVLESDLKNLIEKKEFKLLIQPKINVVNETIHGGEILSRWIHPKLGLISPLEFIPLLEDNDLMSDYSLTISKEIIECCKSSRMNNSKNIVLAINVNASSLKMKEFVDQIISFSKKLSPYILEIELTEDVFLQLDSSLSNNLDSLKKNNIRLALDDFGTGFSNMSYLQDLNVDTIKIDKRFITPLSVKDNSYGIVKALIGMAHTFNIGVVAEGVETEEQLTILKELNCDIIQGYYYYKPLTVDDFNQLL